MEEKIFDLSDNKCAAISDIIRGEKPSLSFEVFRRNRKAITKA